MADVPPRIPPSEITPERAYAERPKERRLFLRNVGLAAAGAAVFGGGMFLLTKRRGNAPAPDVSALRELEVDSAPTAKELTSVALGDNDALTKIEDVTTYNNFYEFGLDKSEPAENAGTLVTRPWTVNITGEVAKPERIDVDELIKLFPPEERIYRMRCVEAWSMVIPWVGIPLAKILKRVQPTSRAKYVAFKTLLDPKMMPGQRESVLAWPYVEGLRIDEAMHPLTLMAVGLYGRELPNQNGAPFRLVVPWKYGFKGIKSIVEISLVEEQPRTTWSSAAPSEYGFYANVNPDVAHPRWSQASERRIGVSGRRPTLPFNGYGEQVGHLYANMDLRRHF